MTKIRIIAAIEIGSSKVATLIGQIATDPISAETSINVVGAASVDSKGIKKGQVVDIEEAVEATISSVEAAERMAGCNLDSAYVAIGGAHIHSQNSHGVVAISDPSGEITGNDVDRVIEAASAVSLPTSREIIHVLPREFVVDGETGVKDPVGMSGVRLEVDTHIVSAASAAVKNVQKALKEVGIEITDLVFSGLASAYTAVSPTEKELGSVLVDIGGGTTEIAVIALSGIVSDTSIRTGGDELDTAIRVKIDSET